MEIPQGLAMVLSLVGLLLIIFAIADVVLANFFGIDLTGVTWSPVAAGITGGLLIRLFAGDDDDE